MGWMALQMQIDHSWTPARMHEALSLGKGRNARALFHDVFITVAPHSIRSRSARRARPPAMLGWVLRRAKGEVSERLLPLILHSFSVDDGVRDDDSIVQCNMNVLFVLAVSVQCFGGEVNYGQ